MTATTPATTSMADTAAPAGASEAVLCPLCEYDLRGLVEPRCPECGYQFTWEELRDRARAHPYLFEHHPERNARALRRTFVASLRPRRFWRDVRPTHEVRPRRLLLYWALVAAALLAPYFIVYGFQVVELDRYHQQLRLRRLTMMTLAARSSAPPPVLPADFAEQFPVLPNPRLVWLSVTRWRPPPMLLPGLVMLAWPWVTLAALLVFQASMRRAQVRTAHVLRCVVYSADGFAAAAAVTLAYAGILAASTATGRPSPWSYMDAQLLTLATVAGVLVVLTYRLWIAYRTYLRFRHALATVVAAQVMVALLVLKFGLDWKFIN